MFWDSTTCGSDDCATVFFGAGIVLPGKVFSANWKAMTKISLNLDQHKKIASPKTAKDISRPIKSADINISFGSAVAFTNVRIFTRKAPPAYLSGKVVKKSFR